MIISIHDPKIDTLKRFMVDANIAISYLDAKHALNSEVKKRLQDLYIEGATFYYSQPVLLEVKNYWRRKLLTECIEQHIQNGKRLFSKFEKKYLEFRSNYPLNEYQLKLLRETLENIAKGKGVDFWFALCNQALGSQFGKLDQVLSQSNFKYAKFNDEDVFPLNQKSNWPEWESTDMLMEKYGLASNDAAILNMVNGGLNIEGFISNDGDILFAAAKSALGTIPSIPFSNLNTYQ